MITRPFVLGWFGTGLFAFVLASLATQSATAQVEEELSVDVLIGFHEQPNAETEILVASYGGVVTRSFSIIPAVAATVPAESLDALEADPDVALIEIDGIFQAVVQEVPYGISKIEADVAHSSVTGEGVVVAVIDTGVNLNHPDLVDNLYFNLVEVNGTPGVDDDGNGYVDDYQGWDFVNNDNNPDDDNSHGTHCAGTIGAMNNDIGVLGAAPGVKILPLKVLGRTGGGSFSSVIAAVEYCVDNNVHVTSNSYGSGFNPGSLVQAAFAAADDAGILNVCAAGNSGNSSGTGDSVIYPAKYPECVAVAATNSNDQRANFSSTGPDVEVAAPGVSVLSTVLGTNYGYKSGTSMACPHVAGAAALLIEAGEALRNGGNGQRLTNDEVRALLSESAVDLGATGPDNLYGNGRIDVVAAINMIKETAELRVSKIRWRLSSNERNLRSIVTIQNVEDRSRVEGATVTAEILWNGNIYATITAVSNTRGLTFFRMRNAPAGQWNIRIMKVEKAGYTWDGSKDAPDPGFVK